VRAALLQQLLQDDDAADDVDFAAMFDHRHPVALARGGVLHAAHRRDMLSVNSVHYQGIGRLAAPLAVEAQAPDGLIEAVSATIDGAPVLAVQWHPEWDADSNPDSAIFFHLLGRTLRGQPIEAAA